jgi:hypothetical protein
MLTFGEATILDYNKIIMELSSLNLDITRTEADIAMLKTKLRAMSGEQFLPEFQNYPGSENLIRHAYRRQGSFIRHI